MCWSTFLDPASPRSERAIWCASLDGYRFAGIPSTTEPLSSSPREARTSWCWSRSMPRCGRWREFRFALTLFSERLNRLKAGW